MTLAKAMLCPALLVSWCSAALGDILLEGAIYCDTPSALSEMVDVARAGDDKGLARLVATGHVAPKTLTDIRVKVLACGEEPDSPVMWPLADCLLCLTRNCQAMLSKIVASNKMLYVKV